MVVSTIAAIIVFNGCTEGNTFNGGVYTWLVGGETSFEIGFLIDQLSATMMVVVTSRVADGAHLHHRLHGGRSGLQPVLQLHLALHVLDADAGDVATTSCSCSSAGRRWASCRTC